MTHELNNIPFIQRVVLQKAYNHISDKIGNILPKFQENYPMKF